jgi:phage shock protein A
VRYIFIGVLLALGAPVIAHAQDLAAVESQAGRLRSQLLEVAGREEQLRQRARQLEEDMDPRNVERSVAGVGTTDARALRDQRRQQLEREKAQVDAQLASLAASRYRLEAAISTAEAEIVRLRAAALSPPAQPASSGAAAPSVTPSAPDVKKRRAAARKSKAVKRGRPRRHTRP